MTMTDKVLAGRYRLVELIGEGGMAYVYRAIDQKTEHSVAIKVMKSELGKDADYVSRFQREAEAASKMTHHNIVNLLDVGMEDGNRYLVIEYVQGKTLKQLIQEKGQIPPKTAAQITIRILSALQHAHQNGIIHRDIKPQNILVADDGHIKVADFGIARIANSHTLTRDDSVMGTVYYYSPEQASGQKVGATSDIYSVGVVLYEMLTGRVPFGGDNQVAIAMQHIHAKPAPISQFAPNVPPAIAHVCMMAMAKDPRYRYQSAREMASQLRLALEGRVGDMAPRLAEQGIPLPEHSDAALQRAPAGTPGRLKPENQSEKPRRSGVSILWVLSTLTVTVMVLFGLYMGISSIYEKVVNTTDVPDLVGLEFSMAERRAATSGLYVERVDINHPNISSGLVIMQSPQAEEGIKLHKGDSVLLTVSKGPASLSVPRVIGLEQADAIAALQAYGLTMMVVDHVISSDHEAGLIMSQVPEPGAQCQKGDIVQVTVSGTVVNVPTLTGKSLRDAELMLSASGLVSSGMPRYVDTEDEKLHGTVASQFPAEGTAVIQGTGVQLTVYQKPGLTHSALVTINLPNVAGPTSVRVTLMENGVENTVFQGSYEAADSRRPEINVTAQLPGVYTYRVYCNGEFSYLGEVAIN
ncbi:MAG: Stk1 family PASTA domain-containing Ser/Thr kinase [bacterium]|nr:Stk1 family PASTA domain-containing Ser/Thr kinase [bacterium]